MVQVFVPKVAIKNVELGPWMNDFRKSFNYLTNLYIDIFTCVVTMVSVIVFTDFNFYCLLKGSITDSRARSMDEYFSSAFANEFEHISKDVFRTLSNQLRACQI